MITIPPRERVCSGRQCEVIAMRCAFAVAMTSGGLWGCSQSGQESNSAAPASVPASGSVTKTLKEPTPVGASTGAADNACDLLTDTEIRSVFPDAADGQRETGSLQYGLDRCAWKTSAGQIGIEVSKIEVNAFENELRGQLEGFVDPRIARAVDRIPFHAVDGIGERAVVVLEKADAGYGLLSDVALIAVEHRHRMVVLMLRDASLSASSSRESLETLARKLAARL